MSKIKIFKHNQPAVAAISKRFKKSDKAAVVMCTGIGKTSIAVKFLQDRASSERKNILIAPTWVTWSSFKKTDPELANNTVFFTYAGLIRKNSIKQLLAKHNPKLIVVDEFRRAGARLWGIPINKIMQNIPVGCKILGTEATPIRMDGGEEDRNMAHELFGEDGVVYEKSINQAIEERLIKKPKLVIGNCNFEEIVAQLKKDIDSTGMQKIFAKFIKDWRKSNGVVGILKRHLRANDFKIVTFCKDIEGMKAMTPFVEKWFKSIYPKTKITIRELTHLNSARETDAIIEEFRNAKKEDGKYILMTVNKVNDSFHDNDLNVVIQFRETMSANLDLQQKGRALSFNSTKRALLFDLVCNIKKIKRLNAELFARYNEQNTTKEENIKRQYEKPKFDIVDETKDFSIAWDELQERLSSFSQNFEQLKNFVEAHGRVPTQTENKKLGQFVTQKRIQYRQNKLSPERIEMFEKIGVNITLYDDQLRFEQNFSELEKFVKQNGRIPTHEENSILARLITKKRAQFKNKKLSPDVVNRFKKIGVDLTLSGVQLNFEQNFSELEKFIKQNGHTPTRIENGVLCSFVSTKRAQFKNKKLSPDVVNRFRKIGVDLTLSDTQLNFEQNFSELEKFVKQNGRIPTHAENKKICQFVTTKRIQFKNKKLSPDAIKRFEKIGVDITLSDDQLRFEQNFSELEKFVKQNGRIPTHAENKKLGFFVVMKRTQYRQKKLSPDVIKRFEKIGVDITLPDLQIRFEQNFSELEKFVKQNKRTPTRAENGTLYDFVRLRRAQHQANKLSPDVVKRFKKIGVDITK